MMANVLEDEPVEASKKHIEWYHRQRKVENPRQGKHSSGPTTFDFCGEAARRRSHALGLQHPERSDLALGLAPPRRLTADRLSWHSYIM